MKIKGTRGEIFFDMENGYQVRALGELLMDHSFEVYTQSFRFRGPPHETEPVTPKQIRQIMRKTDQANLVNAMKVFFSQRDRYEGI